jgi:pilus assembly protein CpaF
MLQLSDVFMAQSRVGVGSEIVNSEVKSYSSYLQGCRNDVSDKTPHEFYDWDNQRQNSFTKNCITKYVMDNKIVVDGYVSESTGELEVARLIDRLITDIVDFGILRPALDDESVQEIQINDFKTIYVIRGGTSELYTDERGNPYQFVSDVELKTTINRMTHNPDGNVPRLTESDPLLNARTASKGYRLSAVDGSAVTKDLDKAFDFPCTSISIRKYSTSRLTFTDFEKFGSMVPRMSKFLRLCGRANTRLVCVGATSSGKTTLLQAIAWEIPKDLRIIFIQNPTELMLYDRDPVYGFNRRNALHWEAREVSDADKLRSTTPTMANFIAHTLRNTPDVVVPGEIRTPEEFYQANRVVKTGHRVMTTFHAEDAKDAASRWANELSAKGGSELENLRGAVNSIDVVVAQAKLSDGSGRRKVMQVAEYTGRIIDGEAEVSIIFEFVLTGEMVKDAKGRDVMDGYFQQVNPISEKLINKFFFAGVSRADLEEFIHPPKVVEGKTNIPLEEVA